MLSCVLHASSSRLLYRTGSERGFTLIEVLAVVAIVAIVTTLVLLRLGDTAASESPDRQLERLAALIEAQCGQAMFQSRSRGVRFTAEGYDFWQSVEGGWLPLPADGLDRPRRWMGEVRAELDVEGHRVRLDQEAERPHLACEPLGGLTAFSLALENGNSRAWLGSEGGHLVVEVR